MRSFLFLVNPASGGGAGPAVAVPVARLLRDSGAEVEVAYSTGLEHTAGLVRTAAGRGGVVVSVGGDGMLSSVAGEVAGLGGVLGLLPAGRGNDFARTLGLPADPVELADLLLHGAPTPVDLISFTTPGAAPRLVVGSVYAGVDAHAAEIVDGVRWLPSRVQYPYAAVSALSRYVPASFEVVVDGRHHAFDAATVVVANSGYYGKGMHVAPGASVCDGLLDVVVVGAASRRDMLRALPRVYRGTHTGLEQVTALQGTTVELSAVPGPPVGGDGEPLGRLPTSSAHPARIEVVPAGLQVLTAGTR